MINFNKFKIGDMVYIQYTTTSNFIQERIGFINFIDDIIFCVENKKRGLRLPIRIWKSCIVEIRRLK